MSRRPTRNTRTGYVFASVLIVVMTGLMTVSIWRLSESVESDATADRILLEAASLGLDLDQDIHQLAAKTGIDYRSPFGEAAEAVTIVVPRSSGELLLKWPLLLVPKDWAHDVMVILNVGAFLVLVAVVVPRICRVPLRELLIPGLALPLTIFYADGIRWGNPSCLVALLTAFGWLGVRTRPMFGTSLGLATTLKLYPGLGLVPWIVSSKARRAAFWGLLAVVVINGAGSLVLGVSLTESAVLLTRGAGTWIGFMGNWSLAGVGARAGLPLQTPLVLALCGVLTTGWITLRRPLEQAFSFGLAVAVIVSPLSWIHYDMIVVPTVLMLWAYRKRWSPGAYVSIVWILTGCIGFILYLRGGLNAFWWVLLMVRVVLAVAIAVSPSELWEVDGARTPDSNSV